MTASRHGVTIVAVLLVIAMAALAATTMIHATDAQHAIAEASIRRTQSRALAWSGLQGVMAELSGQRDELLDGAGPQLTREWELFTLDDGRRGVVRLLPVGRSGELWASEAGKLNVNTAALEMLSLVPGLDETFAQRIVELRSQGPIQSVESLTRIEGITPDMLFGVPVATKSRSARDAAEGTALIHLLTAHSAEPNVQVGRARNGDSFRGERRINLNMPWSERLGRAIARRYDEEFAQGVKGVMESEFELTSEGDFVRIMRQFNNDPETFVEVLDVFCATPDPYTIGCVDLLTAPVDVLATIPGIDQATAEAIVTARDSLDSELRRTVVWPVLEGVMSLDQFQGAVDVLASRSMQWRVRLEAGIARASAGRFEPVSEDRRPTSTGVIAGSFAGADRLLEDQPPLEDRIVLDAVIDVASMRPRVAYLRDVTYLELAMQLGRPDSPTDAEPPPLKAPGADSAMVIDEAPHGVETDEAEQADDGELSVADADTFEPFDDSTVEPTGAEPARPMPEDSEGVDRRIGRWAPGGASR